MLEAFDAGALGAVVAGIGKDLAADVGTDKFQVDLQALNDYYYKVHTLWMDLNRYADSLPKDPYSKQCMNTSEIPGVARAIQASMDGALGSANSMTRAIGSVRTNLSVHLKALADVYSAYVNIDHQNATELTQAGAPSAANINVHLPVPANSDLPPWVRNVVSSLHL
jgi:hypothetical protein